MSTKPFSNKKPTYSDVIDEIERHPKRLPISETGCVYPVDSKKDRTFINVRNERITIDQDNREVVFSFTCNKNLTSCDPQYVVFVTSVVRKGYSLGLMYCQNGEPLFVVLYVEELATTGEIASMYSSLCDEEARNLMCCLSDSSQDISPKGDKINSLIDVIIKDIGIRLNNYVNRIKKVDAVNKENADKRKNYVIHRSKPSLYGDDDDERYLHIRTSLLGCIMSRILGWCREYAIFIDYGDDQNMEILDNELKSPNTCMYHYDERKKVLITTKKVDDDVFLGGGSLPNTLLLFNQNCGNWYKISGCTEPNNKIIILKAFPILMVKIEPRCDAFLFYTLKNKALESRDDIVWRMQEFIVRDDSEYRTDRNLDPFSQ